MGDKTGISWTDATWSPVRGCSRVSEGCRNCYAERIAARFSDPGQPFHGFAVRHTAPRDSLDQVGGRRAGWTRKVEFQPDQLAIPLRWKKSRRIFCSSMTDIFHESLTNEQIAAVFGVMAACPQHSFQVLTKRAKRMREWFEWLRGPSENTFTMQQRGIASAPNTARALLDAAYEVLGKARKPELDAAWHSPAIEGDPWPLPNVWLGVSVENQEAADERIPELLATPAAVRFLSCEPLLGPVNLTLHGSRIKGWDEDWKYDTLNGCEWANPHSEVENGSSTRLDWVIAGCESGPGARPADPAWFRSLRDRCAAAGVPFFLKQAEEHTLDRVELTDGRIVDQIGCGPGSKRKAGGVIELPYLDGVQHCQFPETTR